MFGYLFGVFSLFSIFVRSKIENKWHDSLLKQQKMWDCDESWENVCKLNSKKSTKTTFYSSRFFLLSAILVIEAECWQVSPETNS